MADHHPELEPRLSGGPRSWAEDRPSAEEIIPPTDAEVAAARAYLAGERSPAIEALINRVNESAS